MKKPRKSGTIGKCFKKLSLIKIRKESRNILLQIAAKDPDAGI
jgi:hypothetical protein